MRFWVGVTSAFGAGTLIGIGIGILSVEKKLKEEYAQSSASMRRAYEAARIDAETPSLTEEDLIFVRKRDEGVELEGFEIDANEHRFLREVTPMDDVKQEPATLVTAVPQTDNPYHKAVHSTLVNEAYASYAELEEEDYFDEDDGRSKEQITMVMSDDAPIFFMDGSEIDDAFERVGGTIVDDMRKAVGNGEPVVYIRNNQTNVDYEVVFEQP